MVKEWGGTYHCVEGGLIVAKPLVDWQSLVTVPHQHAHGTTKGLPATCVKQVIHTACCNRAGLLKEVLVKALELVNDVHRGMG
jgi:hypothetical protein